VTLRLATTTDVAALSAILARPEVYAWWGAGEVAEDLVDPEQEVYVVWVPTRCGRWRAT
jgi:hypothetical protein